MPGPVQQQVEGVAAPAGQRQHFIPLVDLQHLQAGLPTSASNLIYISRLPNAASIASLVPKATRQCH